MNEKPITRLLSQTLGKRGQTRLSSAIFPAAVSPAPTFFVIPAFMPFSLREDEVELTAH